MASSTTQRAIERIQREIESLQRQLTNEAQKEARCAERINSAVQTLSRTSSVAVARSKEREIDRLNRELVQIQKKRADLTKKIGSKTSELHRYQQRCFKEQEKEKQNLADSIRKWQDEVRGQQRRAIARIGSQSEEVLDNPEYDAFISHASEDKEDLVRPLAESLQAAGLRIWYDEFELRVGDSLRRKIDQGLSRSRFGIVVLSPAFFRKNWPQYELDGLVAREMSGGKVILPLWHHVSKNDVLSYSPALADRVALNTALMTLDEIVDALVNELKRVPE